jgi:nucleotide-binding universal stress UspA family protein
VKKILIAVDDTRSSKAVIASFCNNVRSPEEVIVLHVERLEGRSLMIDMLGEAEMSTLREALKDTEHKKALDRKAERILSYYKNELEDCCGARVKTVLREGRPSEEILKVAEEEGVDLIILGYWETTGLNRLIAGSVSREVKRGARMPVLTAKKTLMCEEPYSWSDAYDAVYVFAVIFIGLLFLGIFLS